LTTMVARVDDQAIAVRIETLLLGHAFCHQEQMPEKGSISFFGPLDPHEGLHRDDEQVRRSLGIDVPKDNAVIVAVDEVAGNFTLNDAGEEGLLGHVPSSRGGSSLPLAERGAKEEGAARPRRDCRSSIGVPGQWD
jgi:hypothetical protein